jgi:dissimilatory sulfite reductase (desulfoviridin) alpha/beta subunit
MLKIDLIVVLLHLDQQNIFKCISYWKGMTSKMEWTEEAESAIKKVPFFVRKRVRARVEEDTRKAGRNRISLDDVRLSQKRYLSKMGEEIKGYQLESCFGASGCPNPAADSNQLLQRLEEILQGANFRTFLEERVKGGLKHHHEFRVAVSDCPNACSQPQIKDIGIIGAHEPVLSKEPCSLCHACEESCQEHAILLNESEEIPVIDFDRCIRCGRCIRVCPTGTIDTGRKGYRIMLGGKLGRHPRLGEEISGIYHEDEVIDILEKCIEFYKNNSAHGERFAELFKGVDHLGLKRKGHS